MGTLTATVAAVATLIGVQVHLLPPRCASPALSKLKLERLLALERRHLAGVRQIILETTQCTPSRVLVRVDGVAQDTLRFELELDDSEAFAHRQLASRIVEEVERSALLRIAPRVPPTRRSVELGTALVFLGAANATLVGPGVALSWRPSHTISLTLDARYLLRRTEESLGQVKADMLMLGAHVAWRWRWERVEVAVGPEVIAGYGWIRGVAVEGRAQEGSGGGVVALAGLRAQGWWTFGGGFRMFATLSGGGVLASLRANVGDERVFELGGLAAGASVGLSYSF